MSGSLPLDIHGETLLLHPERAVIWPQRRTVIVADTHFGKSAVFRRHGVAVPSGSDEHDRQRLTRLIHAAGARRLMILGDFLHAPMDAASGDARDWDVWNAGLHDTEIVVIAGNHDRGGAGDWRPAVQWHHDELVEPPFRFTHDADRSSGRSSGLFTLSGHIHPTARIRGLRKRSMRVPIFWRRDAGLVLPAFGVFTGGYVVTPAAGDSVFAAGPEGVVRFR